MSENKQNLISKIKGNKKVQYFIIAILFVLLIIILFFFNKTDNKDTSENSYSIENYINSLENKLSNVLSQVEGAGKVEVVISVDSGMENVLATEKIIKDTQYGEESVETPIIVNGNTVIIKELYPKIKGVLIVSEGAKNINVMRRIQEATVSLLDIDLNQIEILTMK